MTRSRLASLKHLEGRQVCLALADGDRIDHCQLISIGRSQCRSVWIFNNGCDRFLAHGEVVDCWESLS